MVKKMSLAVLVAVSMLMVQTVVPMQAGVRYSQVVSYLKNQEDPAAYVERLLDNPELKNFFNLEDRADMVLELVNPSEYGDTVLAILARKGKGRAIRKVVAYLQDYQARAEANPNLADRLARMVDPYLAVPGDITATIKKEITNDPNGDTTLLHIAARAQEGDPNGALNALLDSGWFTAEDTKLQNKMGETPLVLVSEPLQRTKQPEYRINFGTFLRLQSLSNKK